MVEGRHSEAYRGGDEKSAECKDVGAGGRGVAGREYLMDVDANESEGDGAEQVRVNVDSLIVEVVKRGKRFAEG